MLISSNLEKLKYSANVLLKKDEINNLNKDSIVKTDVMYRIREKDILFKVGKVELEQIMEYKNRFKKKGN